MTKTDEQSTQDAIRRWLRDWMEAEGLSQADVARVGGVSRSAIGHTLTGYDGRPVPTELLIKVGAHRGMSAQDVADLLNGGPVVKITVASSAASPADTNKVTDGPCQQQAEGC